MSRLQAESLPVYAMQSIVRLYLCVEYAARSLDFSGLMTNSYHIGVFRFAHLGSRILTEDGGRPARDIDDSQ